ncbi:hypothetical protein GCM10022214_77070 [Actinomadura miaoliensis]|uniref:Secreted protein n=1 Tax=Actinomadura miaoliensis TaxID=430685 RepID=A0ABP7X004_9ACTN
MPPAFSTTCVIWLTALPPAGTSSRTVMEYDTLGTLATTAPSAVGSLFVRPIVPCQNGMGGSVARPRGAADPPPQNARAAVTTSSTTVGSGMRVLSIRRW